MFQYEFFSLKDYLKYRIPHPFPMRRMPRSFVRTRDIRWIRSSYWAEHCLECGAPQCYGTCPNYQLRGDNGCRLLRYGMYNDPHFRETYYHVTLRFKKWGKIETIVYPGSFSPEKAKQVHDVWRDRSLSKARLMHQGFRGLKQFSIKERQMFDSAKYKFSDKEDAHNKQDTHDFLLQLYSHEKDPFTLFFDVTDDADLAFREGITIYPGYNQHCLNVSSLFPSRGKLRAKFYPADNREATVTFLFCEFVQLKPGVQPETYPPQPEIVREAPAETVKCVAWDLDNTVWDGILIESDPNVLTLRTGIRETMEQLDQRGILQVVLSKNNREDVLPVLERLGIADYFVYILANWNAKSANLRNAAGLLNIGIDSFALIDDSLFEREEIRHTLPMVRTYDEHTIAGSLLDKPEFRVPVTEDSRRRRQMYQTEARRIQAAEAAHGTDLDFLRSCALEAVLSVPASEEELLRSYELLQRTNQLNLSGSKYEQQAFYAHVRSGKAGSLILKCGDRFGSYGQVAYLEAVAEDKVLTIREFAMSCRVAGKYVEAALINTLFRLYEKEGITAIRLLGKKTDRNILLTNSFLQAGFTDNSTDAIIDMTVTADSLKDPQVVQFHIC